MAIGIIASGYNKTSKMLPLLASSGCEGRRIPIVEDIGELAHPSPRRVLRKKLEDYVASVEFQLDFWEQINELGFDYLVVLDLLVSSLPEGPGSFASAGAVWKKAEKKEPISTASAHFRELLTQSVVDGCVWFEDVPSAGVVPKKGSHIVWDQAVTMWDSPILFGLSVPLAKMLGNESLVRALIDDKLLPDNAFVSHSVAGVKMEHIVGPASTMAALRPNDGLLMRVRYAGAEMVVDGQDDLKTLMPLLQFLDNGLSNVTPGLVGQLINHVKKKT